ncbi:MAG: hypothetical protein IJT94_03090, partial [Oscillibacter sp.]|nr:hypothetical protein [Oscillibacter sp.]
MPRKKISAEAENPMDNVAMESQTTEAESGSAWQDGESADGRDFPPNVPPDDSGPLPDGGSIYSGGLPPDGNGLFPGGDSLLSDGEGPDSGEASPDEYGQPPGGIPHEWEADSGGSGGDVNGSPDSMGVSPDALSAVLEGVEVPMRGDGPDEEDRDIPYGEDNLEDESQPPDSPPSGGIMSGAEMPEEVVNGDAPETADTLPEAADPAPPATVETPRRSAAQNRTADRTRATGDSPSTASVGAADSATSRTSERMGGGTVRAENTASAFRTPSPGPVALAPQPTRRSIVRQPAGSAADRAAFFGLQFNRLDRNLTPEQRQEWNSIYASYRGRSVMSGTIVGVDRALVQARNPQTGEMDYRHLYFAVVIPYRVRIVIPETEMWFPEEERPNFVLRNMDGAKIDIIIFKVDRENGLAVGSRKMALPTRRYYFSTQPGMNRPGSRVQCNIMAVGPRRCLVNCHGYDPDL